MTRDAPKPRPVPDEASDAGVARMVEAWDLGVRLTHWLLIAAVGVALFTGLYGPRNRLGIHLYAGVTIAALVAFRLLWGVLGSTYARFSSFPVGRSDIADDLAGFAAGRRRSYVGHNPLGSLMVILLLGALTLALLTGVVTLGGVDKQGPLAFATYYATGAQVRSVHELLAYALLAMIVLHVLGVAYETWHGEAGLVRAMMTGRKQARTLLDGVRPVNPRPYVAGLATVILMGIGAHEVAAFESLPAYGVPVGPQDAAYMRECGSCHFTYPPSLGSAARWGAVMDGLADHFGEDASLSPAVAKSIRAYLTSHSAEHWDTRAAHEFALADSRRPLRLTATPFWIRMHRFVPEAVFKSHAVGAKGACGACHSDASTGRFDPQAIQIPEQAAP